MHPPARQALCDDVAPTAGPILWGGEEIDRLRLEKDFRDLVDATAIPFCTTIGGKSILSERHPAFHGVYNGKASLPEVIHVFKEVARCRIGLGAWMDRLEEPRRSGRFRRRSGQ